MTEATIEVVDWRLPERRRQVFQDFYSFHLKYRSHPGCVYFLFPYLRERLGWDEEQALWFAFLNGNTQNPVASLLMHAQGSRPADADAVVAWYQANYERLAFDTDRRYHKKHFPKAVAGYLGLLHGYEMTQAELWAVCASGGFKMVWEVATSIPTFGRLSAFSYAEYLRVMGVEFDCDDLMLDDIGGSRSHRNGLCRVVGLDQYDWHESNPGFDGSYPRDLLGYLATEGAALLREQRARAAGQPWEHDVSYFTLESTLCTYKGWHRPNRRYPGVYNDMLYNRIRDAEAAHPEADLSIFWEARAVCLPEWMRLEDRPHDPGLAPVKQNWYRETGEVIVMGRDYPRYMSGFDRGVDAGAFGRFR